MDVESIAQPPWPLCFFLSCDVLCCTLDHLVYIFDEDLSLLRDEEIILDLGQKGYKRVSDFEHLLEAWF